MRDIYRYDPDKVNFERIPRGIRFYLSRYFPFLAIALGSTALFVYLFYVFYDSPATRALKLQGLQLTENNEAFSKSIDSLRNTLTYLQLRDTSLYRSINNADPLPIEEREAQTEPTDKTYESRDLTQLQEKVDKLSNKLKEEQERHQVMVQLAREKKKELSYIPSIRPVSTEIISGFGKRRHPIMKRDIQHNGIDFKADVGTKVVATADGTVQYVGTLGGGMGLTVIVNHHNGYITRYAHLSRATTYTGQRVKRGDAIALSGNTGLTKGPHLYYQIDKDNKPIDPIDFLYNDIQLDELLNYRKKAAQYNESMS